MTATPICPRCGYDQSGAVATWDGQGWCPLEGVCSECGLGFGWEDVLRPERRHVPGLYEHADGVMQRAAWAWRTMGMVLLPWVFWKRVPVTVTPVIGRIVRWPVVTALEVWVVGSFVAMMIVLLSGLAPSGATRLLAIGNAWTSPVLLGQIMGGAGAWVNGPAGWVFRPSAASASWDLDPFHLRVGVLTLAGATLAWPLAMLALSDSMRMARVRYAHIVRATGYSFAWLPVMAAVRGGIETAAAGGVSVPWDYAAPAVPVTVGWLGLWWWFALSRGFQLSMAWAIWALLMLISVLVAVIVAMYASRLTDPWY